MNRRQWTIFAVLMILVGLLGGYYIVTRPKPVPSESDGSKLDLSRTDKEKLVRIVLRDRAEGTLVMEKKNQVWASVPPRPVALSASNVDDLVYSFTALYADSIIEENPADLALYGLSPPKAVAEGTFEDGTVRTFYLGDRTPANNTFYLQVKGDPKVYAVWMNHGEHFHWTLDNLRDKTISPAINSEEVTYLRISRADGTVIELKEKTDAEMKSIGLGFGKYLMTRPYKRPHGVDSEKQAAFAGGPSGIQIADFVDDSPKDLSKYGLARPSVDILVRDKANTVHFLLGTDAGEDKRYAMIEGRQGVFTVEKSRLSFIDEKPFDLIDKFILILNIEDVDRIEIKAPGVMHTLTLTRVTKKAETEGESDETVTTYKVDGTEVQEDPFKSFYQALIGLQATGETRRQVKETPEVSVRYFLNKGVTRTESVNYAAYDRDFYAVFMDGKSDFAISREEVAGMLSKLEQLASGKNIAE